jgi:hypothetical protein
MSEKKYSDKVYRLKRGNPLSYTLPSRNHPRYPLLWFDEKQGTNRALRYASNQKSPFEDEQDGNAIIDPIVFEDGMLIVSRTQPVLQAFLHYHPMNNIVFEEVDKEKDALKEMAEMNTEVDALVRARDLTIEQMETMTRVLFARDPSKITTPEMRRDILVFARNYPTDFLQALDDPDLKYQSKIMSFFESKILMVRNNDREIWFNTPTSKKKMCSVPFNVKPYDYAATWLKSDEGLDSLKMLETFV